MSVTCIFSVSSADMKYNFNKIDTLNQGTPYDYNSVMQYEKYGQLHFYVTDFMHCHVYFTALVTAYKYLLSVSVGTFRFLCFFVSKTMHFSSIGSYMSYCYE